MGGELAVVHSQMVYQMTIALNALIFLNSMNAPTVTNTTLTPKNGACMDILTKHLEKQGVSIYYAIICFSTARKGGFVVALPKRVAPF